MRENVKLLTYTGKNDVAWNLYRCNESSKNSKTTVKHKNDGGIILNNSVLRVTNAMAQCLLLKILNLIAS